MTAYILRRLLLIVPTLFGILLLNFLIVQAAPGGPVEQMIARITRSQIDAAGNIGGGTGSDFAAKQSQTGSELNAASNYRGTRGLDPEMVKEIEKMYGFDKPASQRFWDMLKNYARFDFGESFYRNEKVTALIADKLPVSISLGLWTTLLVYLISIPLGIAKAVRDGSRFDVWTSALVVIGDAIPGFLFALLLIILFAGGNYWSWFPLRGLTSDDFETLSAWGKFKDYAWHMALPILSMVIGGFATLTLLTKNSFIEEIGKQYVLTARAKGLSERLVLYGHVFRNAMLIVIAGFPSALISILFTSSLLIEIIFSLDGLGLLGFESVISRDYPVVFGSLFIFTLLGLIANLIGDVVYVLVDPRIDFERRGV